MLEKYTSILADAIESATDGVPPADLIREIISAHSVQSLEMRKKRDRYRAEQWGVPIHTRELATKSNKINNKIANDFFSEIIDTKVGYMFGIPVINQVDKSMVEGGAAVYDKIAIEIQRFRKINSVSDLDSEVCKHAAMCGYDAMLAYIDREGQERVKRIDPWEVVILSHTEMTEPEYSIWYYERYDQTTRAEVYTHDTVYIYDSTDSTANVVFKEQKKNLFDYNPLWGVPNNAEEMGDADKVISLIDGYDRSISDMNSEIEQFRLAYMLFFGVEPDEEMVDAMQRTGAIYMPPTDREEAPNNVMFLTKQINHAAVDSHLDRLDENISRFAQHVNFTDEAFGGNLSGVAMKYKLFGLEAKSKTFERKHDAAVLYMYKVVASAWAKKGLTLDWTTIENKYTRNVAISIVEEADTASKLNGLISRRTNLSKLSFITDVDAEEEQIQREKDATVDLDTVNLEEEVTVDPNKPDGTPKTPEEMEAEKKILELTK